MVMASICYLRYHRETASLAFHRKTETALLKLLKIRRLPLWLRGGQNGRASQCYATPGKARLR